MSASAISINAEITLRPLFTCDACGREEVGSVEEYSVTAVHIEEAVSLVQKSFSSKVHSSSMPVGWFSALREGKTLYICNRCKEYGL